MDGLWEGVTHWLDRLGSTVQKSCYQAVCSKLYNCSATSFPPTFFFFFNTANF